MPLVGYLKTSDPGRISTITNLDGQVARRKRIEPVKTVSGDMYLRMYVMDCSSHEPRGAVVPVLIKQFNHGTGWKELGTASCCPLCWKILVPPVGANLPDAQPLIVRPQTKTGTSKKKPVLQGTPLATQRINQILQLVEKRPISSHDVVGFLGINRPTAVKLLGIMIKMGRLEVQRSGGGRGLKTMYRLQGKPAK